MAFEHGIVHAAAAEDVSQRMTHEFPDPQLALRATGTIALMMAGH
jgi:hypothetical protein